MKSLSLEGEKVIKDIRNLFKLKNELNYTATKYVRKLFKLKKTS